MDHPAGAGMTRRTFLAGVTATTAVAALPPTAIPALHDEAFEEGLARLVSTGPEFARGLSNHAPMAIEALATLGRTDVISNWLDGYGKNLQPAQKIGRALQPNEYAAAFARREAFPDWEATFAALLQEQPWRDVVNTWQTTMLPGLVGALAHGVIRTGHAARALAAKDTPLRRQELARALAYQACNHRPLLGALGAGKGEPLTVLPTIPLLSDELRTLSRGPSDQRIVEVTKHASFAIAVSQCGPADAEAFLRQLLRTTAQQFARHGQDAPIMFLHAFTACSAVQNSWPMLDANARALGCRHAWQLVAAIQARFAKAMFVAGPAPAATTWPADLAAHAIDDGDEHVIKMTAACHVAWLVDPAPEFVAAAQAAHELL